jgi:hypothetical protein
MRYRARRRLSLLVLLIGLPAWIVLAVTVVNWADRTYGRQPIWIEVAIYAALGILFFFPFRSVFRGIGREDSDGPAGRDGRNGSGPPG